MPGLRSRRGLEGAYDDQSHPGKRKREQVSRSRPHLCSPVSRDTGRRVLLWLQKDQTPEGGRVPAKSTKSKTARKTRAASKTAGGTGGTSKAGGRRMPDEINSSEDDRLDAEAKRVRLQADKVCVPDPTTSDLDPLRASRPLTAICLCAQDEQAHQPAAQRSAEDDDGDNGKEADVSVAANKFAHNLLSAYGDGSEDEVEDEEDEVPETLSTWRSPFVDVRRLSDPEYLQSKLIMSDSSGDAWS